MAKEKRNKNEPANQVIVEQMFIVLVAKRLCNWALDQMDTMPNIIEAANEEKREDIFNRIMSKTIELRFEAEEERKWKH